MFGTNKGIIRYYVAVEVADLGVASVFHTDLSPAMGQGGTNAHPAVPAKWVETFVDAFMLSAGHAMIRSRSGFSEAAAAWGRIPVVYKLDQLGACKLVYNALPGESGGVWWRGGRGGQT